MGRWSRWEPHQLGFVFLLSAVALLEMYYEFMGMQGASNYPKGNPYPLEHVSVVERLHEEWGASHRHPLLTKYLTAYMGLPHLNVSSLVLHGALSSQKAQALDLSSSDAGELNQILPEEDFGHRYSTCALVSNSASLLQYQFGNEIDGHDVVMRFNDAPTRGFEEHAGRRCTFRAVSGEHARMLLGLAKFDRGDRGHAKAKDVKPGARTLLLLPDALARYYTELRHKFPENIIMYMEPEVGDASKKVYKDLIARLADLGEQEALSPDLHPAGLEAAFFLMQVCKKVSLYGFQPVAPPEGSTMPSALYYGKAVTDADITATAISFLFWRILNTENMVRLRC